MEGGGGEKKEKREAEGGRKANEPNRPTKSPGLNIILKNKELKKKKVSL